MRDKFKAYLSLLGQYYERILVILALIVLIGFAIWLFLLVNGLQSEIKREDNARPKGVDSQVGDVKRLESVENALEQPVQWETNDHRVFIAPLMKQSDPNDPFPKIWNPEVAEGTLTPEGLPIGWLQKYGLPTTVPIANIDSDNDGFTNREEYEYGTDPRDPNSHPDYVLKLRTTQIIQKPFQFIFNGIAESTTGLKFSILRRDGRVDYYVKMDEMIPDPEAPDYKVIHYEEKYQNQEDPTIRGGDGKPLVTKLNVSELTLQRGNEPPVVLVKGNVGTVGDLFAKVYFILEDRSFEVGKNSIFTVQNTQYQVISIKKLDGQKAEVVVRRLDNGKDFSLRQLMPEDIKKHP